MRRRTPVSALVAAAVAALAAPLVALAPLGAQVPSAPSAPSPQTRTAAPVDSVRALPFDEFHRAVAANHPVARQAGLARQQAREELRIARGAFDPTLSATVDRKARSSSVYYNYAEAELKIPTPFGSDVKLAYERALGTRIANDRYTGALTGNPGILKLGFSVPVGQRLITDERRNALAQARALQDVAEADRGGAVNKLLLSAAKDYARWYEAHRRRLVQREGLTLAEFRLRAIRARVQRGESAPIDTIEASLEVQRRDVARREAEQLYYATSQTVANYLWDDAQSPLDLAPGVVPTVLGLEAERVDSTRLPAWLELAARQHPDVRKIAARVDQAAAQRLFAMQQVIPFAELSLNSVSDRGDVAALTQRSRFDENYVLGGTVRTPLLFMRERGRYNVADQRLDQQQLEQSRVVREVALDVRVAVNDLATMFAVLELQREAVRLARLLLNGEQRRFEAGESQLLVVNLRERLLLDEELKLAATESKYASTRAELAVALGEPAVLPQAGAAPR
ncbi:MAG TPA: TolC family protein [Gemmatirosa sp.]|nr:TolC family protein [Gemmatirosa sp.]